MTDDTTIVQTCTSDGLFEELLQLKPSLAKTNQPLIPAIIATFSSFKEQLVADLTSKFDSTVSEIKDEFHNICQAKDAKIKSLENSNQHLTKQLMLLENKMDATEAYERKDTLIISGAVPGPVANENTNAVVINLVKDKLGFHLDPKDISISHRLQAKKPNSQGVTYPPNLYVKLVHRDTKQAMINASRAKNKQNKNAPNKIFINEGLTPRRRTILQSLLRMKKVNDVIRGVTTQNGVVVAFTAPRQGASPPSGSTASSGRPRDVRHLISTREELRKFCAEFLQKPLEDFLTSWPQL